MGIIISLQVLQVYLIPISGFFGIFVGIKITNTNLAKNYPGSIFWLALSVNFILLQLAYLLGGDIWARLTYAFMMGCFAFSIKLLR